MPDNTPKTLNKPTTTTKINKTREVKMEMDQTTASNALFQYLKRHYPHFRGFTLDEIEIEFKSDGNIHFHAFKETTT